MALTDRAPLAGPPPTRRAALARLAGLALPATVLGAPAVLLGRAAHAQATRRPTPAQTEGPFYPVDLPRDTDADLLRQGDVAYARGQPAWLEGTVSDLAGQPVAGAVVEIWQCDVDGHYRHPGDGDRADPAFQAFGRVVVDRDGRYRFRTIRPAPYSGRTPHIHVKVKLARRTLLTTQFYVEGDPGNARDPLWRSLRDPADRAALTLPFTPVADGLRAEGPIVVAA
ncbi:protocatechuate 3,4-dioxygenase [Ideonella sp. A 288]|uniref:dioxygenase family protein n=1 Tax=Ideonella sp. A 288 TaxID=1962181 RepID=UPI000B4B1220|nr:protocatechuate 3,4-dioxygenase [Ideonella sp. A 288]